MLRAVIFDFDGVITDSEVLHLRAFNKVLAQYGVEISTKDYYKEYLGLSDIDCFKALINKKILQKPAAEIEHLAKEKKQAFEKLAKTEGRIIEGVRDFLQMLSQNNIPMAICSGALSVEIELILEDARLRPFFEVIVSAEMVRKGKPSPDGFLLTLKKLNSSRRNAILPNQCIVIEDSHWGLEAAKAAGMHSVAVTNSYEADQLTLAEKIVTKLGELSMSDLQTLCG
ncbi:MAG: HAD family phosphatase [Phycisphaerae bacterium]|nr:HAD family phosphatase [Phycisphaerae bacterium]MDD5381350.1 HAD family phosphatase [Phycisphaerae bacterium]